MFARRGAAAASDLNEGKKDGVGGDGKQETLYDQADHALSVTIASENGGRTHFVRVSNLKNFVGMLLSFEGHSFFTGCKSFWLIKSLSSLSHLDIQMHTALDRIA